ncbi:MAG: folate-binding protein YgfZ [Cocleimonas sp.]|nr:folate-binding protein YgfZ [Cocleimonas sp.]
MKSAWKEFLIDNGAEFEADQLVSFGNPSRESRIPPQGSVLSDLSDRGIIQVQGNDAEDFLQNQLTNDIRRVTESTHQLSAWCSPKGRVIVNFRIFKRGDAYFLMLSADLVERVLKKLRRYVMMSKVTLEDVSEHFIHFGYAGEYAEKELENIIGQTNMPREMTQTLQRDSLSILRLSGTVPRFEILGELDDAKQLWDNCNVHAAPVSRQGWDYLNIVAGLPVISAESSEAWIPQMLNLQLIDGVDFKKGCYPGQEIVARLKYLGKNKRRMYRIEIDTDKTVAIGQKIYAKGLTDSEAGKILTSVVNPQGKIEALAILKIAQADKSLCINTTNKVTVLELPYSADND